MTGTSSGHMHRYLLPAVVGLKEYRYVQVGYFVVPKFTYQVPGMVHSSDKFNEC